MPEHTNTALLVLRSGDHIVVTRDQILEGMAEFDRKGLRDKATVGNNKSGWSIEANGERYNPKWVLKLATDTAITKFSHKQARETLSALGFKLHFDDDPEGEEAEEADELTFDLERNLQKALRANIVQLEAGLVITDGGKEREVECGRIDITAEDSEGAVVVIELKVGEARRRAVGQILGYMGCLSSDKKPVRGILVARDFSPHAKAATRVVPGLHLRKYNFKFTFEIVGAA